MNDNWETPQDLFDQLDEEFGFVVDLAASSANWKCPIFFGPGSQFGEDSLEADWTQHLRLGAGWLNPPYSRGQQRRFVEKALRELTRLGRGTVVALLPADTSTRLFHDLLLPVGEIRFLPGRIRFELGGVSDGPARFASMLWIVRGSELKVVRDHTPQPSEEPSREADHSVGNTRDDPDSSPRSASR